METLSKKEKNINDKCFPRSTMGKKEVLSNLIDQKKAAILKLLINSKEELYLKEISEKSNVSLASTFRILQEFVNQEILERKEWKNSKTYKCKENEKMKFLAELFYEEFDGLNIFVKAVERIEGIENILLHGTKNKNKANVLLIGNNINADKVDEICNEIKQKGFEITFMPLTRLQYDQMAKMGLYSGEKKVLL